MNTLARLPHRLAALLVAGTLAACAPAAGVAAEEPAARNVIFINGDGMGAAHREAARLYHLGQGGRLAMDRLPYSGQLTTSPKDPASEITDSAAGATAWATGQRTYNGAISVDTARRPLPTLGAQAKAAGRATGLVTTAQVTDASPAAFYANAVDRDAQDDIARQYLEKSKPDVILGGGEDWWLPKGNPGAYPDKPAADPTEASRGTEGNLISRARSAGYQYVSTPAQLAAAGPGKLLGLFANEEMFQQRAEGKGDAYQPVVSLPTMTSKALDVLSADPDGFFLFVEEEAVDEFAHQNNATRVLQAMWQLDRTVAVARAYADAHPDTLVVVAGDHETGGLSVEAVDPKDESGTGKSAEDGPFAVKGTKLRFTMDWTTTAHTGEDVPVTAVGPQAGKFTGKHPNTHVYDVLAPILTS
ncbi:alkaline phosphatase [Actinoplanes lobatus]|uniref:Alkaline phosphatase n=1 Tax=Actinoplanes lobatus TaxID=113568 RepID=A0A7W7HR07_9ACTN|nr:alkaline phosphatase [Actinoplanes lobatus]MBB4755090.1 alkaline phosphatase [Actinoplanes lobatus]GGN98494.1 alkaline phosphatase [Actinoplanes lobatus]GIE40594.1 alkaline phosphatase [Actinoplanes lobatus]